MRMTDRRCRNCSSLYIPEVTDKMQATLCPACAETGEEAFDRLAFYIHGNDALNPKLNVVSIDKISLQTQVPLAIVWALYRAGSFDDLNPYNTQYLGENRNQRTMQCKRCHKPYEAYADKEVCKPCAQVMIQQIDAILHEPRQDYVQAASRRSGRRQGYGLHRHI